MSTFRLGSRTFAFDRDAEALGGPPTGLIVVSRRVARLPARSVSRLRVAHVVPPPRLRGREAEEAVREGRDHLHALAGSRTEVHLHTDALHALRVVTAPPIVGPRRWLLSVREGAAELRRYLDFRAKVPFWERGTIPQPRDGWTRGALELMRRDLRMRDLVLRAGPPWFQRTPATFESVARAIVYQQLTGRAAGTIWERLRDRLPDRAVLAEALASTPVKTLRSAGLSGAKTAALRDLSARVLDGRLDLDAMGPLDDDEVIAQLVQVRGIGPWSARMHLMFRMRRPDVWPVLDLGVRKGLQRFHGLSELPDAKQAQPLGEPFRPYRSIAAWYMWRALEVDVPS